MGPTNDEEAHLCSNRRVGFIVFVYTGTASTLPSPSSRFNPQTKPAQGKGTKGKHKAPPKERWDRSDKTRGREVRAPDYLAP
jgi:hypothetical protein